MVGTYRYLVVDLVSHNSYQLFLLNCLRITPTTLHVVVVHNGTVGRYVGTVLIYIQYICLALARNTV